MQAAPSMPNVSAAMVLAAGFGTRLRPLTEHCPKPLVPLGDRPVLAHIVGKLRDAGFSHVVVNVHHAPEVFDGVDLPIRMVQEDIILGTAGGVAGASEQLGDGSVVVCNGDIVVSPDWAALDAAHVEHEAFATLALAAPKAPGQGTVGLDEQGRIVRLRAGRFGQEVLSGDFVGVQILSPRARNVLPTEGCLVGDVYLPALERGECVVGVSVAKSFEDIGTLEAYHRANMAWLRQEGGGSVLADGAHVGEGVRLDEAVVGAGAQVTGQGVVRRCVLWPGARVEAPCEDVIALPDGRLVPVSSTSSPSMTTPG